MREYSITRRRLLDEAKPHYGAATAAWIGAAIAAAGTAASIAQGKAQQKEAKKRASAARAGTGGDTSYHPTAEKFAEGGDQHDIPSLPKGKTLGDIMGGGSGSTPPATEHQQGFSLKESKIDAVPEPQPFNGPTQQPSGLQGRLSEVHGTSPGAVSTPLEPGAINQPAGQSAGNTAGQIGGYAQQAAQLYQMIRASKQAPAPGPRGQNGPINTTPTAFKFGV